MMSISLHDIENRNLLYTLCLESLIYMLIAHLRDFKAIDVKALEETAAMYRL